MRLPDEVRRTAARIAADARHVRIVPEALGAYDADWDAAGGRVPEPELDPERHYLEGTEEDVAQYLLTLDAINFGSGWFPTLRKRALPDGRTVSGYFTVAWALADRCRAHGPWSAAELRAMRTEEVADVLGQRRDHELMALYAQALRSLGAWLGERTALDVVREAGGSAVALAEALASGMALFDDRGFWKRAQIVPADLQLAGVASFRDVDELTIFADNLVPHVLRCDGLLAYEPALAQAIDAGELLPMRRPEREVRGCAVHVCEELSARLGVPARLVDQWLWTRGQQPGYKARPRHRCRTVFY